MATLNGITALGLDAWLSLVGTQLVLRLDRFEGYKSGARARIVELVFGIHGPFLRLEMQSVPCTLEDVPIARVFEVFRLPTDSQP